ncbi:MAG TPA: TraR/DksA family transcriptional regulator [Dongiaceae bacterium]|nr:TraR/DksA family transcriptional regulator [Dongiaceae bacterium]
MLKATAASNSKKLIVFERILQTKGDDLRKLIAHQREEMTLPRDPDDEGAAAQWSVDRDLAMINLNRAILTLSEVEAALHSIEEGEFGFCRRCEEPISDARLNALPWTRLCLECAGG